jgi:glucosamine-6-phosphate deaminase
MEVFISETKELSGKEAAVKGAGLIRRAIAEKGEANIILATGTSQFEMLNVLVKEDIDWSKVTGFHLDEYIGLSQKHPASFRKYLKERFVDIVSTKKFNYIDGEADAAGECSRLGELISKRPVDVAFVGIGENGHLAFNDPPADFETEEPYIIVKLDEVCRRQQLGEGWFASLDEVPDKAISMSINQIMRSKAIICSVPDLRKAKAVKDVVSGPVTPDVPASVLQQHNAAWIFLDRDSASLLA